MSPLNSQSGRSMAVWLTCALLLSCMVSLVVSVGVLTFALGRDGTLAAFLSNRTAQAINPSAVKTAVPIAVPMTLTPPGPSAESSIQPIANPAAATATALAKNLPASAGATLTATLSTPDTNLVTREITEAQIQKAFADYMKKMGVTPTGLSAKISDKKLHVSADAIEAGMFSLGKFDMTGTFVVKDGKVSFVLQESPPNFPFTGYIAQYIDEIVAGLVGKLRVTQVDIQEGKLLVSGTQA
jgi:hypothetical protein